MASRDDDKDLIDGAIMEKSKEMGIDIGSYTIAKFTPFDPVSKEPKPKSREMEASKSRKERLRPSNR